jgi:general secretion pathway protein G
VTRARRSRRSRGFTLVELAIVVAILGVLAAITLAQYLTYIERVRVARAIIDLKDISSHLDPIAFEGGKLPSALADIGFGTRKDPWGRLYEYLPIDGSPAWKVRKDQFLVPLNSDYDLYSKGKDGRTQPQITNRLSLDDVIRGNDGGFLGLAAKY